MWLNISKTEVVLFRSAKKQTDVYLKVKLECKIDGKYLGIKIDENVNWNSDISIKPKQSKHYLN